MNASEAKSLTTYYTHIDQIDPILAQHMTYAFADKSPGLTFPRLAFRYRPTRNTVPSFPERPQGNQRGRAHRGSDSHIHHPLRHREI